MAGGFDNVPQNTTSTSNKKTAKAIRNVFFIALISELESCLSIVSPFGFGLLVHRQNLNL